MMLNYKEIKLGEKVYKLRLGIKETIELERKLGTNPVNFLMQFANSNKNGEAVITELPKIEEMVMIIGCSLTKYQTKIKMEDVYSFCEEYMEQYEMSGLFQLIMEIFTNAGFFKNVEMTTPSKSK